MNAARAVHRDESAIERPVERCRQQQAIGGVVAALAVLAPRHNMAGGQEARVSNAGDAAGLFVVGEHCATEEVLADPLVHDRLGGGLALPRSEENTSELQS